MGDVSGADGTRPRWIDRGYVANGGDAHRRAIEAALDKRETMIDVGVYNGLDQLSILGYVVQPAWMWHGQKGRPISQSITCHGHMVVGDTSPTLVLL